MARYRFFLICIIAFLFLNQKIFGQERELDGLVKDANSKETISGAIIRIGKVFSISDSLGRFSIKSSLPLNESMRITLIGYQEKIVPLETLPTQNALLILLTPSDHLLNQMVVTAGRYEQSLNRMVVSTEIIQPYLIQNRNTTMMDKLLDQIPSVNIIDGQINIRSGSGWTYGAGSRVMVLLDGMPFLTGDAGQVKWNFVPIENVKQIEVVKGASSVLYGSSALSGIVHLRTEMANNKPISRFSVFSGAYSKPKRSSLNWSNETRKQYGASAFHSFKKNKLQMAFSGNYLRDEGYRMGESDNRLRLNANLLISPKTNFQYGINFGTLASNGGSFLLWESYEKAYTILDSQITSTKSFNYYFDPFCSFYTGAFKHNFRGRWMQIINDITNPDPLINQDNQSKNLYGEYQVQRFFSGLQLMLTAGAVSSYNYSNSPLYSGTQQSRNHAAFLQLDQTILHRLSLTAGARYEYFNMNGQEEGKPVFRAGANYELAKASFLRASYGQGYRFPSIAERYIQTSVGALNIFPNPALNSETGWNAEIGFKQGFSFKKIKGFIDLAFFYSRYQNMIDFNLGIWKPIADFTNPFPSVGFISLNIGETQIPGLDVSINLERKVGKFTIQSILGYTYTNPIMINIDQVFATDSLGNNYTFRNTRSDSTDVLKYRYKHLFKWDLQLGYKKWLYGYSIRYNSYMQNIDAAFVELPLSTFIKGVDQARKANANGNIIIDMRLSYQINDKYRIAIIVNNIFNAEVMTRPADMRPPRLTLFQLNYAF
jgi:iron complex outermembrane receptor protein